MSAVTAFEACRLGDLFRWMGLVQRDDVRFRYGHQAEYGVADKKADCLVETRERALHIEVYRGIRYARQAAMFCGTENFIRKMQERWGEAWQGVLILVCDDDIFYRRSRAAVNARDLLSGEGYFILPGEPAEIHFQQLSSFVTRALAL